MRILLFWGLTGVPYLGKRLFHGFLGMDAMASDMQEDVVSSPSTSYATY